MTNRAEAQPRTIDNTELIAIAVDLGGTHLRAAAIDRNGEIHFRFKRTTPAAPKLGEIVEAIVAAVDQCAQSEPLKGKRIAAVSIGVPGTVSFHERRVITVPNIPCLANFHLGQVLRDRLGYEVLIENDANAAAVGEMWLGAGRGYKNIICVTLGTGVGGGIILDGELLRGVDGSAGEIGHTGVDPFSGVRCKCGSEGCLEVFASATAIVRMAREALSSHSNSALHSVPELTAKKIFEAASAGDELGLETFRRMGVYLGVGLANLVNLLNPEIIMVGGGVANGWELFSESMQRAVSQRAFPVPARRVKITRAECGDDAGLLGAAHLALSGTL